MIKGKAKDNLKYKKSLTVKEDVISEKIIIKSPNRNTNTRENLYFEFSFGYNNKKHKLRLITGKKRGLISRVNNSFCISLIAGSLQFNTS
mgnify:CR=1 FL=1